MLVLNELKLRGDYLSITSMIKEISKRTLIPESSLRNYVRTLKELGLIDYGNSSKLPVELTTDGTDILKIIERGESV